MTAQNVLLPNGMKVVSKRQEEALLMYGEVGTYLKYGLRLDAGATIMDVGANIGIFSLWAYHQLAGQATIYAFEPVPTIYNMLKENFARIDPANLHAFDCGLSDAPKELQFAYYPNATFASTAYPDSTTSENQLTETLLARSLHQLPMPLSLVQYLPRRLQMPIIHLLARYINHRQTVTCQLQTLSDVIRQQGIERIDFLKIDAEKSELDILNGIDTADWQKIHQLFIEVHERDHRLETIRELLQRHGFTHIVAEQEAFFVGTDIHALYARR